MSLRNLTTVVAATVLLWTPAALAHGEHCHKLDDGKMVDMPSAKTAKACADKGGIWFPHHGHCHKLDENGKLQEMPGVKDEKACAAKGGKWADHGHNVLAGP